MRVKVTEEIELGNLSAHVEIVEDGRGGYQYLATFMGLSEGFSGKKHFDEELMKQMNKLSEHVMATGEEMLSYHKEHVEPFLEKELR